jgi:alpha-N-arabinofuranosidase
MGHRSADDYGKFALEAAKLMKLTDPKIQLIAAGSSNFGAGADWTGWNRTILEYLKNHADYLSLHTYVGNPQNDYGDFLASSLELSSRIKTAEGIIDAALSGVRGRKIYIAWDEWNVWYRARGAQERGRRILEERYNLEDALVVATFLNAFVNHAHIVKIANMAQLVNVIAPIMTNPNGLFRQTIYHPYSWALQYARGSVLNLLIESPTYDVPQMNAVAYIDAAATINPGDGRTALFILNRDLSKSRQVEVVWEDTAKTRVAASQVLTGDDLKAVNGFDAPERVKPQPFEKPSTANGRTRFEVPPRSYTIIQWEA